MKHIVSSQIKTNILVFCILFLQVLDSYAQTNGKIVYKSKHKNEDNKSIENIYIMNVDGSNKRLVTNEFHSDVRSISLSPDGSRIVFTSDNHGQKIFVIDSDGCKPT